MTDSAQNNPFTQQNKGFFSRWASGIKAITPLQQTFWSLYGTFIVLVGCFIGAITALYSKTWWLLTVLVGSFLISLMSLIGTWQKYTILKQMEEMMNGSK